MSRRLLLLLSSSLLLFVLACGEAALLQIGSLPRWACPSPTPKPYGPAGPIKGYEPCNCRRPVPGGPEVCDQCAVYYAEWEQEYPEAGGTPFPSPTPYARIGGSYTLGQRVEVGPIHVLVTASAGPIVTGRAGIPDGTRQLYFIDLAWQNRSLADIPISYADQVRLRAIKTTGGAVVSDASWAYSRTAQEIATTDALPLSIPPGASQVRVPVLAPIGEPETVELVFIGNPAASYALPSATIQPSTTAVPATALPTLTPTLAGNPDLQDRDPHHIAVQWTAATWVPPGGEPCGDAGALTDWGNDGNGAWGQPQTLTGPPPPPGADRLVQVALAQVGRPYVWGAKGPNAFDCSGLCSWSYAQIGIGIPSGSRNQFANMRPVAAGQIRPGDLIFFDMSGAGQINHVGMLADVNADGAWDLIHAANPSLGVRVDYGVFESAYYQPRIRGFRTAR
jgi:cell wall-associated NlpC family hydrolase